MMKRLLLASVIAILVIGIVFIMFIQKNVRSGGIPLAGVDVAVATTFPRVITNPVNTPDLAAAVVSTPGLYLPFIEKSQPPSPTATFTPTATKALPPVPTTALASATATPPPTTSPIFDSFEGVETTWKVTREIAASGSVLRSSAFVQDGLNSALLATSGAGAKAQLHISYTESAQAHTWGERPGTWFWQRASVYVSASTVQQLGAADYLTLAGLYPSAGGSFGWWLRLHQGGALYVFGYTTDGTGVEFPIYGTIPTNQWVELSLGLHSQNGPGVKRAFALLINGNFFGWYHQGNLQTETYDRAAFGILGTNTGKPLQVYVDSWRASTTGPLPDGPDNRSTASLQEQDFRTLSGVQWQIDWSTWKNNLVQHTTHGLYSATDRLQSGRNLDRMPDLTNGWAEIEIDWPNGTPPPAPTGYFGPMVGFRKEINREENFEIIPIGRTGGAVDLVLEAWVNGGPLELAKWVMPDDNGNNIHIPAPGDIIRVKWQQINAAQMTVVASYFDASKNLWNQGVINATVNVANVGGINFTDGFHKASSITIDSNTYSIRRYKVGTIDTAP